MKRFEYFGIAFALIYALSICCLPTPLVLWVFVGFKTALKFFVVNVLVSFASYKMAVLTGNMIKDYKLREQNEREN